MQGREGPKGGFGAKRPCDYCPVDVFDAFSALSPYGTTIVFSSNRDVNVEIYTMSEVA